MANNNKFKKLLVFILILILMIIPAAIFAGALSIMINTKNQVPVNVKNIIKYASEGTGLTLLFVFWIILCGVLIYMAVKLHMFSMFKMVNRLDRANSTLHGSAHWQTRAEMIYNYGWRRNPKKKYGTEPYSLRDLRNVDFHGYVLDHQVTKDNMYFLGLSGLHCCVIGKTGMGKSKSFLSPTIQANAQSRYKASMIIYDMKGELFQQNGQLLKDNGYNVIKINMRNPRLGNCYNPLEMIWLLWEQYLESEKPNEKGKIKPDEVIKSRVATLIIDIAKAISPESKGENGMWDQGSQGLIEGILWAMLYDYRSGKYGMCKEKFTIANITNILTAQQSMMVEWMTDHDKKTESEVFEYAGTVIGNNSEKTVGSYLSNTVNKLLPYISPSIKYLTSRTDFDMKTMVTSPTAIFFEIPAESQAMYAIATLMITTIHDFLVSEAIAKKNQSLDKKFYFFLDEFANLPKLPEILHWINTDRGFGLSYCLLLQSRNQLKTKYGVEEAKDIEAGCGISLFLGATEMEDLKQWQEQLGTYTAYSRSANVTDQTMPNINYQGNTSLTQAHLVTIQDLQAIHPGQNQFMVQSHSPCQGKYVSIEDNHLQDSKLFKLGGFVIEENESQLDVDKAYFDLADRKARHRALQEGRWDDLYGPITPDTIEDNEDDDYFTDDEINDLSAAYAEDDGISFEEFEDLFTSYDSALKAETDEEKEYHLKQLNQGGIHQKKLKVFQASPKSDDEIYDFTHLQYVNDYNMPEILYNQLHGSSSYNAPKISLTPKINNHIKIKTPFIKSYERTFQYDGFASHSANGGYLLETQGFMVITPKEIKDKDDNWSFESTYMPQVIIKDKTGRTYDLGKVRLLYRKKDYSQLIQCLQEIWDVNIPTEDRLNILSKYTILTKQNSLQSPTEVDADEVKISSEIDLDEIDDDEEITMDEIDELLNNIDFLPNQQKEELKEQLENQQINSVNQQIDESKVDSNDSFEEPVDSTSVEVKIENEVKEEQVASNVNLESDNSKVDTQTNEIENEVQDKTPKKGLMEIRRFKSSSENENTGSVEKNEETKISSTNISSTNKLKNLVANRSKVKHEDDEGEE